MTAAAGGYGLSVTAGAAVAVTGQVGTTSFAATLDMAGGNVKLDVVNGSVFHTSGSITLGSGIDDAVLLGLDAIGAVGSQSSNDLFGNAAANRLDGMAGNDRLYGGLGVDRLYGGDGNDLLRGGSHRDFLYGGAGNDRLFGDGGNDVLNGGAGADSFYFLRKGGGDVIQDFSLSDGDRLYFDDAITTTTARSASGTPLGEVVDGAVVFTFAEGQTITLAGISNLDALQGAVILF